MDRRHGMSRQKLQLQHPHYIDMYTYICICIYMYIHVHRNSWHLVLLLARTIPLSVHVRLSRALILFTSSTHPALRVLQRYVSLFYSNMYMCSDTCMYICEFVRVCVSLSTHVHILCPRERPLTYRHACMCTNAPANIDACAIAYDVPCTHAL